MCLHVTPWKSGFILFFSVEMEESLHATSPGLERRAEGACQERLGELTVTHQ